MSPDFLNRVHQGDCVAGLNGLPAGSVDLAFADPPFNIGYKYDVYDDRREHEHYLDWSRQWIAAVYRVLKPTGTFWLAIGDEYAAELKLASQDIGFTCRSWVVWYYTFGVNCKNKFTRSHAHLFYFVKDPNNFTFRGDAPENRIPSARQLVYNDNRANPQGRLPDDTWILRPQDMADCFTAEEDTWYFPRVAGTFKERAGFHGCQMPEQLLGRIIRSCSHEGEVVLDPFSGSATTLVTAKKLGRQYVGFELSEDYAARGGARVAAAEVGAPLVGAADPTRSAPATPGRIGKRARIEPLPSAEASSNGDAIAPPTAEQEALKRSDSRSEQDAIIEAFRRASDGQSLDRLLTDPKLQTAFQEQCRLLNVAMDAKDRNHALLKLRKSGKLKGVPTKERTELSWDDCESSLAAAEMAAAAVFARHSQLSLDEVFCDPAVAAEFDKLAARFGSAKRTFERRWCALKLRKEAKQLREKQQALRRTELSFTVPISAGRARWSKQLPKTSGVYLILDSEGTRLYVGAATDLRARLEELLTATKLAHFTRSRDVRVSIATLPLPLLDLMALAQREARRSRTPLNWHLVGDERRDAAASPRRTKALTTAR